MAQPLLALLSRQGYVVDVLALPWVQRVLHRMAPVRRIIDMPIGHGQLAIRQRYQLGQSLRLAGYQRAIVLPNTWKSALIPFFAGIKQRTGLVGEMRYGLLNDWRKADTKSITQLVQRYWALGLEADQLVSLVPLHPKLRSSAKQQQSTLQVLAMDRPSQPVIVLCPGSEYGEAKCWPISHYAKLARSMLERGWLVWLMGSNNDAMRCTQINHLAGAACLNWAGKTTLDQAIDLMSFAQVAVTNDSGLMHIACALGIEVVALFGSSSPYYTPPLSTNAKTIWLQLKCSPCFQRRCPLGHLDCLYKISPEQVIKALSI